MKDNNRIEVYRQAYCYFKEFVKDFQKYNDLDFDGIREHYRNLSFDNGALYEVKWKDISVFIGCFDKELKYSGKNEDYSVSDHIIVFVDGKPFDHISVEMLERLGN